MPVVNARICQHTCKKSPMILNLNSHFACILQEQGSLIPQQELTKRLAMKWNTLSSEDKKVYNYFQQYFPYTISH